MGSIDRNSDGSSTSEGFTVDQTQFTRQFSATGDLHSRGFASQAANSSDKPTSTTATETVDDVTVLDEPNESLSSSEPAIDPSLPYDYAGPWGSTATRVKRLSIFSAIFTFLTGPILVFPPEALMENHAPFAWKVAILGACTGSSLEEFPHSMSPNQSRAPPILSAQVFVDLNLFIRSLYSPPHSYPHVQAPCTRSLASPLGYFIGTSNHTCTPCNTNHLRG